MDLPREKTAVDLVHELATDGWRYTTAERLSTYLDGEAATLIDRPWKAGHCKKLAKAARNVAKVGGIFSTFESVLASQSARQAVSCSEVATALLSRAISLQSPTEMIVRDLRVSGIALCAINSCVPSCQCLKDLCEDTSPTQLQNLITLTCDYFAQHQPR